MDQAREAGRPTVIRGSRKWGENHPRLGPYIPPVPDIIVISSLASGLDGRSTSSGGRRCSRKLNYLDIKDENHGTNLVFVQGENLILVSIYPVMSSRIHKGQHAAEGQDDTKKS
ncbi:hypothetical protein RRG08_045433 [Elysia crispata]|uniref:Uncharacterized protein n=1 Tax=Elysia crispata TaxID=231223 RepID=A0AAE1AWR8_9GAST|nr:hypothetical protein RRG08_045433 [Elysia crispata]